MQMRHQPLLGGDGLHQRRVRFNRVDGRNPQTREIGHQLQDTPHQIAQTRRRGEVGTPGGQVHPGQHHLVIAAIHQTLDLVHDNTRRHRARIAPTIGDDAERTAMVTAVLHLHIGARARTKPVDQMPGSFGHGHDIVDLHALRFTHEIRRQPPPCLGLHFLGIADHGVHLGHGGKCLGLGLGGAAGHDEPRIGVFATQFANLLPRLAYRLGGYGAGIDHDGTLKPRLPGKVFHGLGLIGVQPAPKGGEFWRAHSAAFRNSDRITPSQTYVVGPVIQTPSSRQSM